MGRMEAADGLFAEFLISLVLGDKENDWHLKNQQILQGTTKKRWTPRFSARGLTCVDSGWGMQRTTSEVVDKNMSYQKYLETVLDVTDESEINEIGDLLLRYTTLEVRARPCVYQKVLYHGSVYVMGVWYQLTLTSSTIPHVFF